MKQHSQSVDRDLDDEVAEAVELQYGRRLTKAEQGGAPLQSAVAAKPDRDTFERDMEELREISGF